MAPYCCVTHRPVETVGGGTLIGPDVTDAGYLTVSMDGFMRSGGVDVYGAAHALRTDEAGRVVCAPARVIVESVAYNPGESALLLVVVFAAGFLLRHGLAWGAKVWRRP